MLVDINKNWELYKLSKKSKENACEVSSYTVGEDVQVGFENWNRGHDVLFFCF